MENTITIKLPTINQIEFKVTVEPEDSRAYPDGLEDIIKDQLDRGNVWPWAMVEVKGTYRGLTASDNLGGCSYTDQENFERGASCEDMKRTVYSKIIEAIKELSK